MTRHTVAEGGASVGNMVALGGTATPLSVLHIQGSIVTSAESYMFAAIMVCFCCCPPSVLTWQLDKDKRSGP